MAGWQDDGATYCEDLEEILDLAVLRMDARHYSLEIRKALRKLREFGLERRVLEQVLDSIEARVDVRDLAQGHA